MRTAIYVFKSSTITIEAQDARDHEVVVTPFRPTQRRTGAIGTQRFERGIYMVQSAGDLQVTAADGDVHIENIVRDKDQWPDPPPPIVALEEGASAEQVVQFFMVVADS